VFDESRQQYSTLSLFPEDRELPPEMINTVQVKLNEMALRRPRVFGNCWLGCELWRQLELEAFWHEKLSSEVQRETVPWEKVLRLLVVNRLLEPGSEFRVHRHWFDQSAMAELLESDFAVAEKDRLYRCLDRIVEHKQALFAHLRQRFLRFRRACRHRFLAIRYRFLERFRKRTWQELSCARSESLSISEMSSHTEINDLA
jgi:hypothetical protein